MSSHGFEALGRANRSESSIKIGLSGFGIRSNLTLLQFLPSFPFELFTISKHRRLVIPIDRPIEGLSIIGKCNFTFTLRSLRDVSSLRSMPNEACLLTSQIAIIDASDVSKFFRIKSAT